MFRRYLAVAAITLAIPTASSATVFATRAAFNAGVTGVVNSNLDAFADGPITTVFGVETLSSSGNATGANISAFGNGFGQALGGRNAGGALDNFESVIVTFTAPIYAFAFDDLDLTADEVANVLVTFADLTTETVFVTDTDGDFTTAGFFGIGSAVALQSVQIWSSTGPDGSIGSRANMIDNLAISRIALNAVPEPASWAMMIGGFIAVGGAARRRRILQAVA